MNADKMLQALASRLNHDYVSPLTAISNSLEIYKFGGSHQEEALSLIADSLNSAFSELKFNRIAFGGFGTDEQLSLSEAQLRISELFIAEKAKIDLSQVKEDPLKSTAKLWFLCILALRSSFVSLKGIEIIHDNAGWQITAVGDGMMTRDGKLRAEDEWLQIAELTSKAVHFPLLFQHAGALGTEVIRKQLNDETLVVKLWLKE